MGFDVIVCRIYGKTASLRLYYVIYCRGECGDGVKKGQGGVGLTCSEKFHPRQIASAEVLQRSTAEGEA